ncbi:MAG: hypothetical protein Pg6A_07670 [Termitinemataceae bacterium]|nr:MAG: hypothetical protein Pg6A_07670 [Termitinemataceae bacterium]
MPAAARAGLRVSAGRGAAHFNRRRRVAAARPGLRPALTKAAVCFARKAYRRAASRRRPAAPQAAAVDAGGLHRQPAKPRTRVRRPVVLCAAKFCAPAIGTFAAAACVQACGRPPPATGETARGFADQPSYAPRLRCA